MNRRRLRSHLLAIGSATRGPARREGETGGEPTGTATGAPATPPAQPPATPPAQPPATPPAQPPAPAVPPVPTPPPAPAMSQEDDEGAERDVSRLPKWARDELARTRQEAAQRRISERTANVNMRALQAATGLGVNPDALLGSTDWVARAAALDPNAQDFTAQLAAAIEATKQVHPWVAAAPTGPARSGGELPNTPPAPSRPSSLDAAVRARLGG